MRSMEAPAAMEAAPAFWLEEVPAELVDDLEDLDLEGELEDEVDPELVDDEDLVELAAAVGFSFSLSSLHKPQDSGHSYLMMSRVDCVAPF